MKSNNQEFFKPTNDIVFQRLFGEQKNEEITRDLLSKILNREVAQLDLDKNKELNPMYPSEKRGVVDIKAQEKESGIIYDVEMQIVASEELPNRMLFYWSRIHSEQLKKGEDYKKIRPTILILLLTKNISLLEETKIPHTTWKIIDNEERKMILTPNFEMHVVELEKYLNMVPKEKQDKLREWIEFLVNSNGGEEKMWDNEKIRKAEKALAEINADPDLKRALQLRDKWEHDEATKMRVAIDNAKEEGYAKGQKEFKEK